MAAVSDPESASVMGERLIQRMAEMFRLLGDPTRLRLIAELAQQPCSVSALARSVGLSISAVSHQLALLRGLHVVRAHRLGRTISYSLDDEHVLAMFQDALVHAGHTGGGANTTDRNP